MWNCPYCEAKDVRPFEPCHSCGKIVDLRDVVRPIDSLLEQLMQCSICGEKAFDGWHCHKCTYTISEKAKKAHGCMLLGEKEYALVTAHFRNQVTD